MSVVYHLRLRRAVEDPHRVDASDVVTGDDGERASDARVATDDAPHVDWDRETLGRARARTRTCEN